MTNIEICKKCFLNNTSCCTLKSGNGEKMMIPPVSNPEIERIIDFLGVKDKETIFNAKPNSTFYVRQMLNLFPGMEDAVYKKFPEHERHFELKTKHTSCILLGPDGCVLPKEIRPHFCRIYPFWFFDQEPHIFQDSDCLALAGCKTIAEVFLALGTNPEALEQIHSRIFQDWELPQTIPHVERKMLL